MLTTPEKSNMDSEKLLERSMELSGRTMDGRYTPEQSADIAKACQGLMKAYSLLKEVEFHERFNPLMSAATQPEEEDEFRILGEDPLVNPNN